MDPTKFDRLPPDHKKQFLSHIGVEEHKSFRNDLRAVRNLLAIAKIDRNLAAQPDNPKRKRWEQRRAEHMKALDNLARHGQEAAPTGNPVGVDIFVPGR